MLTHDIHPFGDISEVGFKLFLSACMNLAQNSQGKINVDNILPHPTTVSRSVEFHTRKVLKRLEEETKSVMEEQVSAALTAGTISEDHTKLSFSALILYCVDYKCNLRHTMMCRKEIPQGNQRADGSIKIETLKIMGEHRVSNEALTNCRFFFTTGNWPGNSGA